jgi:hypothetical protein
MTIRYLPPRIENHSSRVDLFMRLWDTPMTAAQQDELARSVSVTQQRSAFGNLNNEGTPYPSQSCLISRFHPDFESIIEPGVRSLLATIAIDLDLVTYTSCEGHNYTGTARCPDERHVGIIPRSTDEAARVLGVFEAAARATNQRHPGAAAEAAIMRHTVADGDRVYPAIDLYVSRAAHASWDAYFAELDAVAATLDDELVARSRTSGPPS